MIKPNLIPKTPLSGKQITAIEAILHEVFVQTIRDSDHPNLLEEPPEMWTDEERKFWDHLDSVTNQAGFHIKEILGKN